MGESLTVNIVRDGQAMELTYLPETVPGDFGAVATKASVQEGVKLKSLGLEISSLSQEVAKQLGLQDQSGVVITSVQNDSAAQSAGLEPGLVIVQVNRQDVSTVEEFEKMVAVDDDGSILLLVRNGQGSRFVIINQ